MTDKGVIGFIGLGIMGKPMAGHLMTAGYKLVVHDVNREPVKDLVSRGAREAFSPKEVAEQVEQIITIYENYGYDTEVIVASIRNPVHVLDAALMGADIATIPYKVMEQLINHPLTTIGLERFLADWKKMG